MATVTIWQLTGSPPSWAVRMMADILGLTVELKDIKLMELEHKSPEFRKMNPMGTIPVLKDGDFTIAESHTIMKYLLEKYGNEEHKKLYPSNIKDRALVDQALFFDTGVAFIRVKNIALPAVFEGLEDLTPKLIKEAEDAYDIVEMYLEGKTFVASNEFTLADLSLGSTIIALNSLYSLNSDKFPHTAAWLDRLRDKPFFQNIALPGAAALSAFVKSMMEKNKANK